ncbi:MAG: DUF1080 domain-containing protein [Planctomycetes bacterium]|nr:DUF1080 domain-containing protein [Planctomycetota bacterium]
MRRDLAGRVPRLSAAQLAIAGLLTGLIAVPLAAEDGWRSLFNGKDLWGWETYLGPPHGGSEPIGLNRDPQGVFRVVEVDGAPAIRISGETYGALSTLDEHESFHLRLEFKWGEKRWPPRAAVGRDSGILYNCVGPHGSGSGAWMRSIECNIMEKGCGQWWSVDGAICDVEGERVDAAMEARVPYKKEGPGERLIVHVPGGERFAASPGDGVTPAADPERPRGEWNRVEVICLGSTGIHVVNGIANLVITSARHVEGERTTYLTRGKIQLQSEGAEVFYRKIEIRPIAAVPLEHAAAARVAPVDDDGFTPLLDPALLPGWAQCGPGRFAVVDGVATAVGGMGLWYYGARQFGNFVLRGEFLQVDPGADSGIFVRFPDPGDDPWVAVHQGYEVEIGEDRVFEGGTGSIYSFQAPSALPLRPAGSWNEYEVACIGHEYSVVLNGRLINRYRGSRGLKGYVGLQNYDDGKTFRHRRTRIRELPADASSYGVLSGALKGWNACGPGSFDLDGDFLTGRGGTVLLWHERPLGDFLLSLDWRTSRREDRGGVLVRFADPGLDPANAAKTGYEVRIDAAAAGPAVRTGAIASFQGASDGSARPPGEWNHFEIEARGQGCAVRLNGRRVNDFQGDRALRGHIGLQSHGDASRVSFRAVRVVELGGRTP